MKTSLILLLSILMFNKANAAGPLGSAIAPPTYVGYLTEYGDLGWTQGSHPYKNKFKIDMPYAAHVLCNFWQTGSRAAEYDDFKYIYSSLPNGKYFVMDPFKMRDGNLYTLKTGQQLTITDTPADMFCKDFSSKLSSYNTYVIDTSTNGIEEISCNNKIRIACVKD